MPTWNDTCHDWKYTSIHYPLLHALFVTCWDKETAGDVSLGDDPNPPEFRTPVPLTATLPGSHRLFYLGGSFVEPVVASERSSRRGVSCSMLLGFPMSTLHLLSLKRSLAPLSTFTRSRGAHG